MRSPTFRNSLLMLYATAIGTATSRPLWTTVIDGNHPEVNAQSRYLAYRDPPYYVYNVNAAVVPSGIYGKPQVPLPPYGFYYGMPPVYDFQIPQLNPFYPLLMPGSYPGLPPTSTQQPPFDQDGDYDGIEKLDTRVDPYTETKKPGNNDDDDDSVTVEAI